MLNDTHREKLCFIKFNSRMAGWLLLTFLICSIIVYYRFYYMFYYVLLYVFLYVLYVLLCILLYVIRVQMFEKVIHQIDSKNEWLHLPESFTAKFVLVFVLTLENDFSQRFHFKADRKSIGSSKNRYQGFSKQPSV